MADHDRTEVGKCPLSKNRSSGTPLLFCSKTKKRVQKNLDEVDPELIAIYERLGISLNEQKRLEGIAVDAVLDSVSVATTFRGTLSKLGIVFCSFSEAVKEHPELVKKIPGLSCTDDGQLLCGVELSSLL